MRHYDPEVEKIVRRMVTRRAGACPETLASFASCHESYSEARIVDRTFRGFFVEDVPLGRVAQCIDAPFLAPKAMAYYWPRILQAMLRRPHSRLADQIASLTLQSQIRPGALRSQEIPLSEEDWEDTREILTRMAPLVADERVRKTLTETILWIERRSAQDP
jgi:hypothetical protein